MADPVTVTDDIAEIERRLAAWEEMDRAAIKGPWRVSSSPRDSAHGYSIEGCGESPWCDVVVGGICSNDFGCDDMGVMRFVDARLIAASRALVTAALPFYRKMVDFTRSNHGKDVTGLVDALLAAIPDPNKEKTNA